MENELQRKKKAVEIAQEDINAANGRVSELSQQINDLLSSNNDLLVCIIYSIYPFFLIKLYNSFLCNFFFFFREKFLI